MAYMAHNLYNEKILLTNSHFGVKIIVIKRVHIRKIDF